MWESCQTRLKSCHLEILIKKSLIWTSPRNSKVKSFHIKQSSSWQRHQQQERRQPRPQRRQLARDTLKRWNLTPPTSTKFWSKCTPTLASPRRACPSWTPSSTTSSRDLLLRHLVYLATPRKLLFLLARSRLPWDFSFQESCPSTLSQREPRQLPSSHLPTKYTNISSTKKNGVFKHHYNQWRNILSLLF